MSHYRVLIACKTNSMADLFDKIIEPNTVSDEYNSEIFGFDYLWPYGKDNKSISSYKDAFMFHKNELKGIVSEIIDSNGKELWWCNGIYGSKPPYTYDEALDMIPEDNWCCLFDGHL